MRREGEPFNLEKTANPTEPNVAQPSAKATHVAPGDFFVLDEQVQARQVGGGRVDELPA